MVGRTIGNYEIVRSLGEGGMGIVYLAVHPKIGKKVAIKMLHGHLSSNAEQMSRFFQEARAVNEIGHANIVDIADFGETEDGVVYFVMELLSGRTLREAVKAGPLTVARATRIALQVADALQAAHHVGIIHRDIKPENIFLMEGDGAGDRVKLFDFGLAKLIDPKSHATHKTAAGSVLGSPFYMAPEQVLAKDVDARSDVYALGVVLYEMVAGKVPFQAAQLVDLLAAVVREAPVPPGQHQPGIDAALSQFVLRCLEKDPAARPQSAAEFIAGLKAADATWTTGATIDAGRARPTPPATRTRISAAREVGGVASKEPPAEAWSLVNRLAALRAWPAGRKAAVGGAVASVVFGLLLVASSDAVKQKPAAPAAPLPAILLLESVPPGATVVRISDGTVVGPTPTRDIRPADGKRVDYVFRLPGFVPAHMPFEPKAGGEHRLGVTLIPQQAPPTDPLPVASPQVSFAKLAKAGRGRGKPRPVASKKPEPPPHATATAAAPAPAPASPAPTIQVSENPDGLPPLLPSVRVRRIGKR